eukprot:5617763-Alexandrium_andersonii.AAC.1
MAPRDGGSSRESTHVFARSIGSSMTTAPASGAGSIGGSTKGPPCCSANTGAGMAAGLGGASSPNGST